MRTKQERLSKVNSLIAVIAGTGRRFFHHKGRVARLELDERGRLWFRDAYTGDRVYTAYRGRWSRFSEGGTMRNLVDALCDHIRYGGPVPPGHFGPWHKSTCDGDLWGYGKAMEIVRQAARDLGIVGPAEAVSWIDGEPELEDPHRETWKKLASMAERVMAVRNELDDAIGTPAEVCASAEVVEAVQNYQDARECYEAATESASTVNAAAADVLHRLRHAKLRTASEVRAEAMADYERLHEVCGPVHSLRSVEEVRAEEREKVLDQLWASLQPQLHGRQSAERRGIAIALRAIRDLAKKDEL